MKKLNFKILFLAVFALLVGFDVTAQSNLSFSITWNTNNAALVSGVNYRITGNVYDARGVNTATDVAVGDTVAYIEEDRIYKGAIVKKEVTSGNLLTAIVAMPTLSSAPSGGLSGQITIMRVNSKGYLTESPQVQEILGNAVTNDFRNNIKTAKGGADSTKITYKKRYVSGIYDVWAETYGDTTLAMTVTENSGVAVVSFTGATKYNVLRVQANTTASNWETGTKYSITIPMPRGTYPTYPFVQLINTSNAQAASATSPHLYNNPGSAPRVRIENIDTTTGTMKIVTDGVNAFGSTMTLVASFGF